MAEGDGRRYTIVRQVPGRWHVVSRWPSAGGKLRTVCGRVVLERVRWKQRGVYRSELPRLELCGNCNRMKDAETA